MPVTILYWSSSNCQPSYYVSKTCQWRVKYARVSSLLSVC